MVMSNNVPSSEVVAIDVDNRADNSAEVYGPIALSALTLSMISAYISKNT
jgi:hypothetical protein